MTCLAIDCDLEPDVTVVAERAGLVVDPYAGVPTYELLPLWVPLLVALFCLANAVELFVTYHRRHPRQSPFSRYVPAAIIKE